MIRFPRVAHPEVSITVVAYGSLGWTRRTLAALRRYTPPCYEVIVVDNGPGPRTARFLETEVRGARVILNDRNRGYGPANNQASVHARSPYLLFLNNDVFVSEGWLEPLLEVAGDAEVGAAGPRIENLDGSLQLAGALCSRTGSTVQYGHCDDSNRPQYRFRRDVDYLSGCCLLVRRSAFLDVGGFDPIYGRAYFEDADLCLALAERGYRVVYEPRAVVTHVGGGSGVRDLSNLALRNRALFERRWRSVLSARPLPPLADNPRRTLAARDARAGERLLLIGLSAAQSLELADVLAQRPWAVSATLVASEESFGNERLPGLEVIDEVPDWRAWLRRRRCHFDGVVLGQRGETLRPVLTETQPQAVVVSTAGRSIRDAVDDISFAADCSPDRA